MRDLITCLKAAAVGAIAMYYLDPDLGRRRRAELNDKMRSACDSFGQCVRKEGAHLAHRASGIAREVESSVTAAVVDDYTLVENIRARLGNLVSSPDTVDVSVNDGIVSLAGHVLGAEHKVLIAAVAAMAGVRSVADHLSTYDDPGSAPELQGGSPS
ncbi:BON domain-containing protein [Bordetella sp. LUAb4]|uniref:BON domain-containing protein n=1 Tax=Bordetella sp. LUAb4 TaxID=2843195 RepID=UPI001E4FB6FA|nr:BON domain-containing protein [Bordetella sp. LUAb4]